MKRKKIVALGLAACLLALLLGCSGLVPEEAAVLPLTQFRRSVLDQKVRMLTLRFGGDRYAAYHLENARLDKLWRGGVLWNGAAFNNIKTVQPESYGNSYWENRSQDSGWQIERNGIFEPGILRFKGYRIDPDNTGIRIEYLLSSQGGEEEVEVYEQPSFVISSGEIQYKRDFGVGELPEGIRVRFEEAPRGAVPTTATSVGLAAEEPVNHFTAIYELPEVGPALKPEDGVSTNKSQYWLDRSGCNTCHHPTRKMIGPSYTDIASAYDADDATVRQLAGKVQQGSSGQWGEAVMIAHPQLEEKDISEMVKYILSLRPEDVGKVTKRKAKKEAGSEPERSLIRPGFGAPLEAVHPAYDLITIRPSWFKPRVGGMDFMPDGSLLLSTWDSIGAVYRLTGLESGDTNKIKIQQIASGLSEPLGLTTVGQDIFVMQKHELTQLVDTNADSLIDTYRMYSDDFGVTPDFHEFSYGLVYREGYFYGGLGLAMRLMASELQLPDRGTIFRVAPDGELEKIAIGLRQPNGIGLGPEGEIFVTENQGQWVPACKLIHVQPGSFYGCHFGTGDRFEGRPETPPAVWLPHDEIGNSPGQPLMMQDGPYRGQMIFGEVTHGGVKRVFLEKVKGLYQGCVFRFTQGLEAGINRMAWGHDGDLYVGGVGMNGNWAHRGKQFGLQKLSYNGRVPFELLAVRALSEGFELEFTQGLAEGIGETGGQLIRVQQWRYESTAAYGGPKLDLRTLPVSAVKISEDRKKLRIQLGGLKPGHVVHFQLSPELSSEHREPLWSGDAWYTLNHIPPSAYK